MKLVYQIGAVPLFDILGGDVEVSESRSWSAKRTYFQQNSGYFDHTPQNRRLFEDTDVEVSGTLSSENSQQFLHIMARLKSLGGVRDVPLIVFEQAELGGDPEIRWLLTYGIITSIDDSSSYGEDDSEFFLKPISIKMKIDPVWMPLLNWHWELRPALSFTQTPTAQNGVDTLFSQPDKFSEIGVHKYFQYWPDAYSALTPALWPYLYQGGKGYGSDYASFKDFYVNSVEHAWAAPPVAIYAFTGLSGQGTIQIIVDGRTSELDLDRLDQQLIDRGLSGLQLADEIFVGQTDPFSSFILRNGVVVSNFIPEWTYNGGYPGELQTGINHIQIRGNATAGQFAANIQFGAL